MSNLHALLNGVVHRAKEMLGVSFYVHPQRYRVRQTVRVTNTGKETKGCTLVLPIPQHGAYQAVDHQTFPLIGQFEIVCDEEFSNQVAVWRQTLEGGEEVSFAYESTVFVQPRKFPLRNITPDGTSLAANKTSVDDKEVPSGGLHNVRPDSIPSQPCIRYDRFITADDDIAGIAQALLAGEKRIGKVLKKVNEYCLKTLVYGDPIPGLYSAHDVLTRPRTDCGGYDTLFLSLCAWAGIPGRIVSGFWAGYPKSTMHAWLEVCLPNGVWVPADPSVEQKRCQGVRVQSGALGFVGSDRVFFSVGSDIALSIAGEQIRVDILQHPFCLPSCRDFFEIRQEVSICSQ